jgi:hypothetical protein
VEHEHSFAYLGFSTCFIATFMLNLVCEGPMIERFYQGSAEHLPMHRRGFLRAVQLLLAVPALFVPADVVLCQQMPNKPPQRKLSEVRAIVTSHVNEMARIGEESGGRKLSDAEKSQLVNDTLAAMKDHGLYDFVDP